MYIRGESRLQEKRSNSCRRALATSVLVLTYLLAAAQAQKKPDIREAWDRLLEDTASETSSARVLPPDAAPRRPAEDFLKHFFLESRSEFIRQQVGFSGQPTLAGFTVQQNVFPGPFQPSATTIYQTLTFGTR